MELFTDTVFLRKMIIILSIIISLINLAVIGTSVYRAIKSKKPRVISECLQDIVTALGWELGFFAVAFICIEGGKFLDIIMKGITLT